VIQPASRFVFCRFPAAVVPSSTKIPSETMYVCYCWPVGVWVWDYRFQYSPYYGIHGGNFTTDPFQDYRTQIRR